MSIAPSRSRDHVVLATCPIAATEAPDATPVRPREATRASESDNSIDYKDSPSSEPILPVVVAVDHRNDVDGQAFVDAKKQRNELTPFERRLIDWPSEKSDSFFSRHGKWRKVYMYAKGPRPRIVQTSVRPLLPKVERFFDRALRPLYIRRRFITPVFLFVWLTVFTTLCVHSWYNSTDANGNQPGWVSATSTFWSRNNECGINGTLCEPFTGAPTEFRCPGQTLSTQLLNVRSVGSDIVIYKPLVVGGFDSQKTYRADSWLCAAAIQQGLFGTKRGGCAQTVMTGQFELFEGGSANGVDSVSFDSVFPSSYRFNESYSAGDCVDLRDDILAFDVVMSFLLSFVVRAEAQTMFWVLLVMGFWHVTMASDPSAVPPDLQSAFERFLPTIFFALAFWRYSFRWVLPAYETAMIERTVWYLAGFWVGLLMNISLDWIPIDRLTPHDIKQEPGGLVAVIIIFTLLALAMLNQMRVIRRTGWLFQYLFWYVVGAVIFALLCVIPTLDIRLHHYIAALILLPGCAFVTRPSAIFQGFLLGMFLNGAARWGFDSILQYPASLVGDGALGTAIPEFWTTATNITSNATSIAWKTPAQAGVLDQGWDSYELLVDDVWRYSGNDTTFDITSLARNLTHYFRIAYAKSGTAGDFSKAATLFTNHTWIDPAPGAS